MSKIVTLESAFKHDPGFVKGIKYLASAILFHPQIDIKIKAIKGVEKIVDGAFKSCLVKDKKIYFELDDSGISIPTFIYIGDIPEYYLGRKVDSSDQIVALKI